MGIFDKIKKAQGNDTGKYITPGLHTLELKEIKSFSSNHDRSETVVFEFAVIESIPDTGAFDEQRRQRAEGKGPYAHPKVQPYTPHASGESVSYVCKDAGGLAGEMAMKNAKSVLNCLTNDHADDLDESDWEALTGEAQIGRGSVVKCTAFDKPTKSGDKMITNMRWELITPSEALASAGGEE